MKRFFTLLTLLLFAAGFVYAQTTVTGTVKDDAGEPLIGANILVKGTIVGTVADFDGNWTLEVPPSGEILVFSYTGFSSKEVEIGNQTHFDVVLAAGITLSEAVVTALGVEREEKSLGYAVQEVKGEDLTYAREQNVITSLSGKVAGVQVMSPSGAQIGGSAYIRVRGANSLTGGEPLFVVDGTPISNSNFSDDENGNDYGSLASDINPDDIESLSVLKGPAATALYGNRATGGVILIQTKKGSAREGIGITLNSSVSFDRVSVLPEYQNEYAGGYTQDFIPWVDPVDGQTYNTLNYAADESWGPRIDGTPYRPWWSWFPGTPEYGTVIPLSPNPDNVRDFFETGITYDNSVSFSGGSETTTYRLSYKNIHQTGVVPNSRLIKHNIGINAQTALTEKLILRTNLNFVANAGKGRPLYGYSGSVIQSFNQWFQRQLDIDRLRDYRAPDGTFKSWNIRSPENLRPLYWDSPFTTVHENFTEDSRDRYYGNVSLAYQLTNNLTVQGFLRRDSYTQRIEERTASGTLDLDFYSNRVIDAQEDNYEILTTYTQRFGDLSFDAHAGGNIRVNNYRSDFLRTQGGLSVPNLFNLSASTDRPTANNFESEKVVRSVYGSVNLGYRSFLYLGATLRNDWSSALPEDDNSYLYPSVSASFVFSELIPSAFLSFGKIRASYAQVGSDIGAYQTNFVYSSGTPYGNTASFNLPNTLVNENLKPALTSSYEAGIDLRFWNKVGLDVTYYNQDAEDQILVLTVPGSSGFSSAIINAGLIRSQGVEVMISATPVQTANWNWDLSFNIAHNTSSVEELADGLDNRQLDTWVRWAPTLNAPVGGDWGTFRGNGFTYMNGQPVITESGAYVKTANKDIGSLLPDATGGFRSNLHFKDFTLGTFVDFQIGGLFHSTTIMFNAYSGLSPQTAGLNDLGNLQRDPVSAGGGVLVEGVLEDGTPHSTRVEAVTHWGRLWDMHENWMFDATYVKLREVSLGYNLPSSLLANIPISSARISFIGRNLWLIHSEVDGIDPSEMITGSSNYNYAEGGILPGTRTLGVSLSLGF